MVLESDFTLAAPKFQKQAITPGTAALNDSLIKATLGTPKWFEVGAAEYRELRKQGKTAFPPPVTLERGGSLLVPSRDVGREIHCRVHEPATGGAKGVLYHIHGGGWVLQDEFGYVMCLVSLGWGFFVVVIC